MRRLHRKTTPRAKACKVQHKNRTDLSPGYPNAPSPFPEIAREQPGRGYRHLVRIRHLKRRLPLLAQWDELAVGLQAVGLAPEHFDRLGWRPRSQRDAARGESYAEENARRHEAPLLDRYCRKSP